MRGACLLADPPDRSQRVRLRRQGEVLFRDQIDHLVIRQVVTGVEIDPAGPVPDDDLAHRKTGKDVLPVLKKPVLDPPFVVVEDRPVGTKKAHHLGKAAPLPADIGGVGHAVRMGGVSLQKRGAFPLAAAPVAHAVARAGTKIVGRRGHHRLDASAWHSRHDLQTVAKKKRARRRPVGSGAGRATRRPVPGMQEIGGMCQGGTIGHVATL